jgi:hypothetical protein
MGTVGAANAPGSQKAGARWSGFAVRQRAGDPAAGDLAAGDPAAGDLAIVLEVLSIYGYFDFDNRDEAPSLDWRFEPTSAGFKVRSTASTAAMSRVGGRRRSGGGYADGMIS